MIRTQEVTKWFDDLIALDQVSINVQKGSIYGLVGPNGAGKTTLLKILMGIYRQDLGTVTVMGASMDDEIQVKQGVVFIPDTLHHQPFSRVKDLAKLYRDMYDDFDEVRFNKIQGLLGIDPKKKVVQLSKGMKKQVAFWLAISTKPEVLILDEPVDGLDPVMRKQLWSMILQDVADREMTVIVSSHNLRELDDICDTIGVIYDGRLLFQKDLLELKSEVHKVQVVFEAEKTDYSSLEVLNETTVGKMKILIVKGKKAELEQTFKALGTVVLEFMSLTLEEIFIYEIGGEGYEITNLIL